MIAAVRAGQLGLLVRADRADHGRPQVLEPLAGDQPHPAGRGVEQHGVGLVHPEGPADQVLHGHALEHHRCRLEVGDAVRQLDQPVGRHDPGFGIGAGRRGGVGHAVARLEVIDSLADRFDPAGGLHADGRRQRRQGVEAGAVVDVDEVQADGGLFQADFARAGCADLDGFPGQDLRAAGLVDADRVRHVPRCSLRNARVRLLAKVAAAAS
jgi:hypothetical protein